MSQQDTTLDLVLAELFGGTVGESATVPVACYRNNKLTSVRAPVSRKERVSNWDTRLQNLIPDVTNKPTFKVCFDFASQYSANYTVSDISGSTITYKGERLVDDIYIAEMYERTRDYADYYYGQVLSYVSQNENTVYEKFGKRDLSRGQGTDNQILFINNVLNSFLTTVTVNRVCNDVSTCSLTFRDSPFYELDGTASRLFMNSLTAFYLRAFVPMLPFTVWATGRIYKDFYIPIFTGYITRVTSSINQGYTTFSIDGRDSLELARISVENINPSILQLGEPRTQELNFFSKMFYGVDHFQIVQSIFIGGSLTADEQGRPAINLGTPKNIKSKYPQISAIGNFESISEESENAAPITAVNDSRACFIDDFCDKVMLSHLRKPKKIVCWGYNLTPYRTYGNATPDVYTSNFSNRLEILQSVAANVYFEFYSDGAGNIHYHPMRLSNDYLVYDAFYPVSIKTDNCEKKSKIQFHYHSFPFSQIVSDHESTNVSKTFNVENLVTYLVIHGVPTLDVLKQNAQIIGMIDYAIDFPNLRRYGYRRQDVTIETFNVNPDIVDKNGKSIRLSKALAAAMLKYKTGELYTMTGSFIFRPELEIALPICLAETNEVFYIRSITHTIEIGSTATTVINASFGRQEVQSPVDLLSYMIQSEAFYNNPTQQVQSYTVDSVTGLVKSIDLVVPLTLHNEYVEKQASKYEEMVEKILTTSQEVGEA